jgi:hypothetical protein
MGRFWSLLPPWRPRYASASARRRRCRPPEVCPLEARDLTAIAGLSPVTATTQVLTPPDGRFVPITFSGAVSNDRPAAPIVQVHVIDEYKRVNTVRRIPLTRDLGAIGKNPVYLFSFTVSLEASRADQDLGGRQYYVTVTVKDRDNGGARIVPVIVPHDARHIPQPDDGTGNGAARPPGSGSRPRMLTPGSGRPTGRRVGSR